MRGDLVEVFNILNGLDNLTVSQCHTTQTQAGDTTVYSKARFILHASAKRI